MPPRAATLSPAALDVLASATVTETAVTLPDQLDPSLYREVTKALAALGGKWNRRAGAVLFPRDPRPGVADAITTGVRAIDPDKLASYFRTPDDVADAIAARLDAPGLVLEPSAGEGALVAAVRRAHPEARIVALEPDPGRTAKLQAAGHATQTWPLTFEEYVSTITQVRGFDAVVMNSPFSVPGDAAVWVEHVRMASYLLRRGGRLLAIVPVSLRNRENGRIAELRDAILVAGGTIEPLPDDTFRSAGTSVRTLLVDVTVGAGDRL